MSTLCFFFSFFHTFTQEFHNEDSDIVQRKFVVDLKIYFDHRENFVITRRTTRGLFFNGSVFEQFWRRRMENYMMVLLHKLYDQDAPQDSEKFYVTCVVSRKGPRNTTRHLRCFKITVIMPNDPRYDDYPNDLVF